MTKQYISKLIENEDEIEIDHEDYKAIFVTKKETADFPPYSWYEIEVYDLYKYNYDEDTGELISLDLVDYDEEMWNKASDALMEKMVKYHSKY